MRYLIVVILFLHAVCSFGAELERGVALKSSCSEIDAIERALGSSLLSRDEERGDFWVEGTYLGHRATIGYYCGSDVWQQRIIYGEFADSNEAADQFRQLVESFKIRYGEPHNYFNDMEFLMKLAFILNASSGDADLVQDITNSAFWLTQEFNISILASQSQGLLIPEGKWSISVTIKEPSGRSLCFEQGCW